LGDQNRGDGRTWDIWGSRTEERGGAGGFGGRARGGRVYNIQIQASEQQLTIIYRAEQTAEYMRFGKAEWRRGTY